MTSKAPGADCANCPGCDRAFVPPEPSASPKLAIIGEAPGANEIEKKRPFIGRSGAMMMTGLKTIGLSRSDVHWTNAVLCDVPKAHLPTARRCCAKRLELELAALPKSAPIVPLGRYAAQSCLSAASPKIKGFRIQDLRGSVVRMPSGALVCPTIHPTFVMRVPKWGYWLELDVERIGRILEAGAVNWKPPEEWAGVEIVVAKTATEVSRALKSLAQTVAVDVETVGLGPLTVPLVCLAIADTKRSIVIPWSRGLDGRDSFWPEEQRSLVTRAVRKCLGSRLIVTHNGPAFDHIVLKNYGLWPAAPKWDDTLLRFHVLHGHMPKRLSHVVSTYLDAPPWKQWDHGRDIETMWLYNGRDSLYTAQAYEAIMREKEWRE